MKKQDVVKWQKALRSGKYVQGVDNLITENEEFCCIAVGANAICDLSVEDMLAKDKALCKSGDDPTPWAGRMIGLKKKQIKEFVQCNDEHYMSFDEIADFIEFIKDELCDTNTQI